MYICRTQEDNIQQHGQLRPDGPPSTMEQSYDSPMKPPEPPSIGPSAPNIDTAEILRGGE